jgi:hypothetical protein
MAGGNTRPSPLPSSNSARLGTCRPCTKKHANAGGYGRVDALAAARLSENAEAPRKARRLEATWMDSARTPGTISAAFVARPSISLKAAASDRMINGECNQNCVHARQNARAARVGMNLGHSFQGLPANRVERTSAIRAAA